jgi:hypothetical protein
MRSVLLASLLLTACGDDPVDGPFGPTRIVVVVNPPENDGNTATVPAAAGTMQAGDDVDVEPGGGATTDATGLAVIDTDIDPGSVSIILDGGPSVSATIQAEGDVYDAAIAYNGTAAAFYPGSPIHYAVGGEVVEIATDGDAAVALNTDATIVYFAPGVHIGNLVIEGGDVILFGDSFLDTDVVVDGSIEVRGSRVRIRGVTITGNLTVFGNDFGMSFSVVRGSAQLNGQGISFLANVFCGGANVPSSNAALFDNEGLAPLARPGAPVCP